MHCIYCVKILGCFAPLPSSFQLVGRNFVPVVTYCDMFDTVSVHNDVSHGQAGDLGSAVIVEPNVSQGAVLGFDEWEKIVGRLCSLHSSRDFWGQIT